MSSEKLKQLHEKNEHLRNAFNPNELSDILNGILSVLDGGDMMVRPESKIIQNDQELTQDQKERKMALESQTQWLEPNCVCCDSDKNTKIQRLPSSTMEEALCGRCFHENCLPKEWFIDQIMHGIPVEQLFNGNHKIWEMGQYVPFQQWYYNDNNQQMIENVIALQVPEENFKSEPHM